MPLLDQISECAKRWEATLPDKSNTVIMWMCKACAIPDTSINVRALWHRVLGEGHIATISKHACPTCCYSTMECESPLRLWTCNQKQCHHRVAHRNLHTEIAARTRAHEARERAGTKQQITRNKNGHNLHTEITARTRAHEARERAGTRQQITNMIDNMRRMPHTHTHVLYQTLRTASGSYTAEASKH